MKKIRGLIVCCLTLFPTIGWPSFFTAEDVAKHCFKTKSSYSEGVCLGYIAGTLDSMYKAYPQQFHCVPDITLGQAEKVILKYLDDHPEKLHIDGSIIVQQAIKEAFPCQKS